MRSLLDKLSHNFSNCLDWLSAGSKRNQVMLRVCVSLVSAYSLYRFWIRNSLRKIRTGTDTIVITGASSGMGLVTALYLCDEIGFQVFACVRKSEDGVKIREIVKNKNRMKILILDVTKQETIDKAVDIVSQTVGDSGLYGLFNNAGTVNGNIPLEYLKSDDFMWLFDVNTLGAWRVTNSFLPLLRKAKGTVVNNSSISGFYAGPYNQPYSCTKFALESISDSQRRELRSSGVRVVVLQCGIIFSEIYNKMNTTRKRLETNLSHCRKYYPGKLHALKNESQIIRMAHSAEVVARTIDKSFRGTNPDTRYVVGGFSGIVSTASLLPDKMLDAIFSNEKAVPADAKVDFAVTCDEELSKKDPFFSKYGYKYG